MTKSELRKYASDSEKLSFLLNVDELPIEGIDVLSQVGYIAGSSTSKEDSGKDYQ